MNMCEYISDYKYKTELHAHTSPASSCADFSPEEVVKTYIDAGVDTLVLTNHLVYDPYIKVREYAQMYLRDFERARAAANGRINIILGAEIRFAGSTNDYLVYGITSDDIERIIYQLGTDIETFYKSFKSNKNVIIQAHPFRDYMQPTPVGSVDGVETFNMHINHNSRVARACKFARENNMLITGGSDYHHKNHEASCLMRTKSILADSFEVAEAIKSRDIVLDVGGHAVLPYAFY